MTEINVESQGQIPAPYTQEGRELMEMKRRQSLFFSPRDPILIVPAKKEVIIKLPWEKSYIL